MSRPRSFFLFSLLILISHLICASEVEYSADICKDVLQKFSNNLTCFVNCTLNNAVPVTFCLECDKEYDNLMRAFTDLSTKLDEKNATCQARFFNLDRINLVQKSYQSAVDLWTGGYCDNCFESPLTISNETVAFNNLMDEFEKCIFIAKDVCKECTDAYTQVNQYYDMLKSQTNDKVCFDLQDSINGTRKFWSDIKCNTNPDEKQIPFLIISAAVTALPICFYVLMFAHTHHKEQMAANRDFLNETEPAEPLEESGSGNLAKGVGFSINEGLEGSSQAY